MSKEQEAIKNLNSDLEKNENESVHVEKFNALRPTDKHLVLLYLHYGTIKQVAAKYHCSPSWMAKRLRRILSTLR